MRLNINPTERETLAIAYTELCCTDHGFYVVNRVLTTLARITIFFGPFEYPQLRSSTRWRFLLCQGITFLYLAASNRTTVFAMRTGGNSRGPPLIETNGPGKTGTLPKSIVKQYSGSDSQTTTIANCSFGHVICKLSK